MQSRNRNTIIQNIPHRQRITTSLYAPKRQTNGDWQLTSGTYNWKLRILMHRSTRTHEHTYLLCTHSCCCSSVFYFRRQEGKIVLRFAPRGVQKLRSAVTFPAARNCIRLSKEKNITTTKIRTTLIRKSWPCNVHCAMGWWYEWIKRAKGKLVAFNWQHSGAQANKWIIYFPA